MKQLDDDLIEVSAVVPFTSQLVWWLRGFGQKLLSIQPEKVNIAVRELIEPTSEKD